MPSVSGGTPIRPFMPPRNELLMATRSTTTASDRVTMPRNAPFRLRRPPKKKSAEQRGDRTCEQDGDGDSDPSRLEVGQARESFRA